MGIENLLVKYEKCVYSERTATNQSPPPHGRLFPVRAVPVRTKGTGLGTLLERRPWPTDQLASTRRTGCLPRLETRFARNESA